MRTERQNNSKRADLGYNDLDKKNITYDRFQRRRIHSGDKLDIMSQLDIMTEEDLEKAKKILYKDMKFLENGANVKRKYKIPRTQRRVERLKSIIDKFEGKTDTLPQTEQEENVELSSVQKKQFSEMLRGSTDYHQPIIIKSSSSGALETLLKEVNKVLRNSDRISVIDSGVGPINDSDISNAMQMNAIIYSFDQPILESMKSKISMAGIQASK